MAALLLFTLTAQAAQIEETELESKTRDLSRELRCLVCQGENVWDSNSPLAGQMRDLVRERLRQGESPQQIASYLESRYGDFVLMKPPKHGLNWLLWLGPFALLLSGAFLLKRAISRWRRPEPAPIPDISPNISESQKRKIEVELAKLEDES
ncbi:MAG: cytochrome c-type biogenesis protein CcmH [Sulfuricellaceae bacterium]|nr:cytochrome c-type biogenesis protein CcmH [Sulfuricellaceae bacterium]